MNGYPYWHNDSFYAPDHDLSRTDYSLLGVVLGFFAAILAASLGQAGGIGDLILRLAITLTAGAGAAVSFRCALQRTEPAKIAEAEPREQTALDRAYDLNIFSVNSKVA